MKRFCLCLLMLSRACFAQEWEAPTSPPLYQEAQEQPSLTFGLHGSLGQSRPNDGSALSPAWYSGMSLGYQRAVSPWNDLHFSVELQTGHTGAAQSSIDLDLGGNLLGRLVQKSQDGLDMFFVGGVGYAKGSWDDEGFDGAMRMSLFRIGCGGYMSMAESTRLGLSGLVDFMAYQLENHPTQSGLSQTQVTVQMTLEHLLPL